MACYRSVNHIELYSLALKSLYEFYNTVIKIRDLKCDLKCVINKN